MDIPVGSGGSAAGGALPDAAALVPYAGDDPAATNPHMLQDKKSTINP